MNNSDLLTQRYEDLDKLIRFLIRNYEVADIPGIDAEDLVQEGWLILIRSIDQYDANKGKLLTWAYGVVRRKLLRVVTKCRGSTRHPAGSLASLSDDLDASVPSSAEDNAMASELLEAVQEVVSPAAYAFMLARRDGATYSEAGDILGLESTDLLRLRGELRSVGQTLTAIGAIDRGE